MISEFFQHLYKINGIEAFAFVDNTNHIIDSWTDSKYDSSVFGEIQESYLQIFTIANQSAFDVDEIVVSFDRGLIFARNHPKFFVIIISKPNADLSYIRLAVNVSFFEMEESRKARRILRRLPSDKPSLFDESKFDDAERLMLKKIAESKNVT